MTAPTAQMTCRTVFDRPYFIEPVRKETVGVEGAVAGRVFRIISRRQPTEMGRCSADLVLEWS